MRNHIGVFFFLGVCSGFAVDYFIFSASPVDDMPDATMALGQVESAVECAVQCLSNPFCKGFNFSQTDHQCSALLLPVISNYTNQEFFSPKHPTLYTLLTSQQNENVTEIYGKVVGSETPFKFKGALVHGPITKIVIYWTNWIDGIEFHYMDKTNESIAKGALYHKRVFEIPPGEFINLIHVETGTQVDKIQFITDKGTTSEAMGTNAALEKKEVRGTLLSISGGCGGSMDSGISYLQFHMATR